MQTVPSCQTLYKNSFEYHTVATAPPDFDECWSFIGAPRPPYVPSLGIVPGHSSSFKNLYAEGDLHGMPVQRR